MASGSRRWFSYTDDLGNIWAIERDESAGEATIGGDQLLNDLTGNESLAPARLKTRYVNTYNTANPLQRRKFTVGTPALMSNIGAFAEVDDRGVTYAVSSVRGERAAFARLADTGLDDGDNP